MKTSVFFLVVLVLSLAACTKADPDAYKSDPILQDYLVQLGATNSQLEAANKQAESTQKELRDSVPQSGQASAQQKRLFDQQAQISKLTQQVQFWKIRIESRAREAQLEYLKAFREKKDWPDKGKADAYFAEKRLRLAKMQWDQKSRIAEYEKNKSPASGKAESGQGSHGGGH